MGKSIKDVCVVVQARLGSTRVPGKMLRPFADSTLVDILFTKLKSSKVIPSENILFSAYEDELKKVANNHCIKIFHRSEKSAMSEGPMQEIYEWHNKIPFKYVVLISACNPLLKIETIDKFINSFIHSSNDGSFAVFKKNTYYWDMNSQPITDWQNSPVMNTKLVEPIYEAAHCLYASKLSLIKDGFWMDSNYPPSPNLFEMEELEAFDIDYPWQFDVAETLYKKILHNKFSSIWSGG